jgi:drug/metabolite transporter (DMT)-like permease
MSTTRPPSRLAVGVALAIVYVIWGSTYLGIRVVAASLPAFGSAALRFGIAAVLLAVALAVLRGWRRLRVSWRQLGACAVVGVLLLAGGNGMVVLAESPQFGLPSGIAALVISLNPLIMVTLRSITGDRPRLGTVIGVVIGLAGLVALFLPGLGGGTTDHPVPLAGGLLALGAVICWCVGSFATRWLPMPADPFVASGSRSSPHTRT